MMTKLVSLEFNRSAVADQCCDVQAQRSVMPKETGYNGQCNSSMYAMGDDVISGIAMVLGLNKPNTVAVSQNVTAALRA